MNKQKVFEQALNEAENMFKVAEAKRELWGHLIEEHGLTLLESELDEILIIAERTLDKLKDIK